MYGQKSEPLVITNNSFIDAFDNLDITNNLTDVQAAFGQLTLEALRSHVGEQYLNGENVSTERFYNEFMPEFLKILDEHSDDVEAVINWLYDQEKDVCDVQDYLDFLSEKADDIFADLRLDLNSSFLAISELKNAYNNIVCGGLTFEGFVAVAENDFEDYMKEEGLSLGVVQDSYQEYFDWEKFADAARIDYSGVDIEASNSLNYSGTLLVR